MPTTYNGGKFNTYCNMDEKQTAIATVKTTALISEAESKKLIAGFAAFTEKVEVTRDYFEPAEGEPIGVYYMGQSLFKNQEKEIMVPAVDLLIATGKEKGRYAIAAQAVVVSTLSRYPEGTPFEIIFTGTKKLEGGKKLHEFSIKALFAGAKK